MLRDLEAKGCTAQSIKEPKERINSDEQSASHGTEGKPLAEGSIFQTLLLRQNPQSG